jgi:KDO2-lipid IV(A) lauroyltransferase
MRVKPLDMLLLFFYSLFVDTIGYLPMWAIRFGCRITFLFLYPLVGLLLGLRRRIARNIQAAYGESLTSRESKEIARRVIYNQLVFFFELFFYYHGRNREVLREWVSIEGMENLVAARKASKGVIGVSAHLGSFQLMMLRLSLEDSRFVTLIKNPKSKIISDTWKRYMDDFGLNTIMMRNRVSATKEIIRNLRRSAFIMFVADERTRRSAHVVSFFGKDTSMAAGPAQLSLKMGIPMLPCFIIREDTGRYRIVIEKAIEIVSSGDYEADCLALSQKRIEILEGYVRRYTDQWLWTQSRWKKKRSRKR